MISEAALLLWMAAFQSPLVGQTETSQSRFASLWTREAAFSEPELLALGQDPEPVARQLAALRLAEIDPPSKSALAALVLALGDPAEEVRFQALAGLMRIGRPATRVLADALSDLDPVSGLSRSDLAFAALIYARDIDVDALLSAYAAAPLEVTEVLEPMPPRSRIRLVLQRRPTQLTSSLYNALQAGDVALRVLAADLIGSAGEDAEGAVPLLAKALAEDSTPAVREAAAFALAGIPGSGPQALRGLLRHGNPEVRSHAIRMYPADAADSAELVAALLRDPAREVQRAALERIQHPEGPYDDPCLHARYKSPQPALLNGLPDSVLPDVMELAGDADAPTRAAAARALGPLGCARPESAVAVADALVARLSDPVEDVVSAAVHSLGELLQTRELPEDRRSEVVDALERILVAESPQAADVTLNTAVDPTEPEAQRTADRTSCEPAEVRSRIFDVLPSSDAEASIDRETLYVQLESSDAVERGLAASTLLSLHEDPWSRNGLIAMVLVEAEIRKIVEARVAHACELLDPSGSGTSPIMTIPGLLPFPWPPPAGYSRVLVPRELIATSERTTLGDVYRKLVNAIEAAGDGFEHGLFLGPGDGFSLVARMERIERDGTPLPEPARWMQEGSPKLSLLDLLSDLFFEKLGYFRIIVFAVTNELAPGQSPTARLPEPDEGAAGIPREIAMRSFDGKDVLALIYSFERRSDARILPWKEGAPSARQHLEKAGVWRGLEAATSRR